MTWFTDALPFFGLMLILLALNAILVACEISLVKLRYSHMEEATLERLRRRQVLRRMLDNADQTARLIRFGKTGSTIAIGMLLMAIIGGAVTRLGGSLAAWLLGMLVFLVAVLAHYLIGEIIPRGFALHNPIRSLRFTGPPVALLGLVAWPIMALIRFMRSLVERVSGFNLKDDLNPLDVEVQIRALGDDTPALPAQVRKIINRALQMRELTVHDILLPRNQVQYFDYADPLPENLELARTTGHTRFPLCDGDLDHCFGIVHIKDIFRCSGSPDQLDLKKIKRDITRMGVDEPVVDALQKMLRLRTHMALVMDDFGGVLGVVTLEAILEELVGEIQDEFDHEESQIIKIGPETFRISGLTPLHDVEERLEIDLDAGDVSTFGGLITGTLGRLPEEGELLQIGTLAITVRQVDEMRVQHADVRLIPVMEAGGDDAS
ncbi:MAG: hemolysin family protein [Opitutales bacterium]